MNADLVRAPGFEATLDQRSASGSQRLQYSDVGYGSLALVDLRSEAQARARMSLVESVDGPGLRDTQRNRPILPVYAGELQSAALGMKIKSYDEKGNPIFDDQGELVCEAPAHSRYWSGIPAVQRAL